MYKIEIKDILPGDTLYVPSQPGYNMYGTVIAETMNVDIGQIVAYKNYGKHETYLYDRRKFNYAPIYLVKREGWDT